MQQNVRQSEFFTLGDEEGVANLVNLTLPPNSPALPRWHEQDPNVELTLETLLTSASKAAAEKRLGLQRGAVSAAFVHEDGSPCAIATAFSPELLKQIVDAGDQCLNWLELMRAGYFQLGSGIVMAEALSSLQVGYDRCFDDDPAIRARRTEQYLAYIGSLDPAHPPEVWPSEVSEHPIWED